MLNKAMATDAGTMERVLLIAMLLLRQQYLVVSEEHPDVVEKCYDVDHWFCTKCLFYPKKWWTSYSWAEQFCTRNGGELIAVVNDKVRETAEEFVKVAQHADDVWISARRETTLEWSWISQIPLEGVQIRNQSAQTDFRINMAMSVVSKKVEFNARHPTDELAHVCQYNGGSGRCKDSSNLFSYGRSCYVVYNDRPLTWHEARNHCVRNGGDLAVLDQINQVTDTLVSTLTSSGTPVWIGARSSWWRWSNGEEMRFSYWMYGQPKNSSKLCVTMSSSSPWHWTTRDCADKDAVFICEKKDTGRCSITFDIIMVILAVVIFVVASTTWMGRRAIFRRLRMSRISVSPVWKICSGVLIAHRFVRRSST